ncbi:MAG: PEGA domain-containing protein [Nitrospiraceae bacterium]
MKNHEMEIKALMLAAVLLSAGCATTMNSDHQSVTIFSSPPQAQVTIDDLIHVTTPGTVSLNRKADHVAMVEREGYEPATMTIERGMSLWVIGDIWCVIFVVNCIAKDRRDGGYWTFDDEVTVTLTQRATADSSASKSP